MTTSGEALRLLLVDDDVVDRMAVLRSLQKLPVPVDVTECGGAREALQVLGHGSFDCVISDFEMPGDNGLWLLEQVKRHAFDVPVVILTGQGDEQTAVSLMKAGALDYVTKGIDIGERVGQVVQRAVRTHRAEREARLIRERLVLTLEATGLGTWEYEPSSGRVRFDKRCQELLELDACAMHFEQSADSVCEGDRSALQERLREALRDPSQTRFHSEHRCLTAHSNRVVWVEATGRVFWERGVPVRLVGTLADITARKKEEIEIRQRIEFEQQLIGIVSHDLRNPIAAMMLGARLIADSAGCTQTVASAAKRVVSSGDRATRLIRDLLDFTQARLGKGLPITPAKADLHQVCKQVIDELVLANPGRSIEHRFTGTGECVWDADRFAQALSNLVRNALSYSPPTSVVQVWTRRDGDDVIVAVHNDNLQGPIPAEIQPALFQPFRRGDRKHDPDRSIGLGLYIVGEVARAHGGRVEVRSTAAEGTTFTMRLPCRASAPPEAEVEV